MRADAEIADVDRLERPVPAASALPARLVPSGPGNISGKIVSTDARHMIRVRRSLSGASRGGSTTMVPPARSISGTAASVNGSIKVEPSARLDFQNVAGAEILHRDHFADGRLVARHRRQADEIGVIEGVVFLDGGKLVARDIEIDVAQRLGGVAIVDAVELRHEMILGEARILDLELARSVFGFERAVSREVGRLLREGAQAHFALEPMRGADLRHADPCLASVFRTRGHCPLARGRCVGGGAASFAFLGGGFLLRSGGRCARGLGGFFRLRPCVLCAGSPFPDCCASRAS